MRSVQVGGGIYNSLTVVQLRGVMEPVKRLKHVHKSANPNIVAQVSSTASSCGQVCGKHTEQLKLDLHEEYNEGKACLFTENLSKSIKSLHVQCVLLKVFTLKKPTHLYSNSTLG